MKFGNKVALCLGFSDDKYLNGKISMLNRFWRIILTVIFFVLVYLPFGILALVNSNLEENQRHNIDIIWFFIACAPVYFSIWLRELKVSKRFIIAIAGFVTFFFFGFLSSFVKAGLNNLMLKTDSLMVIIMLAIIVPLFFAYVGITLLKPFYKKITKIE